MLSITSIIFLAVIMGYYPSEADNCSSNETYLECGPNCEKKCSTLSTDCSSFDLIVCPGGCYCLDGYARNFQSNCILEGECGSGTCGRNEIYSNCGPGCDLYCDDLFSCNTNSFNTCTEGCYCAPGFIRNRKNNLCIRQAHCNKKN